MKFTYIKVTEMLCQCYIIAQPSEASLGHTLGVKVAMSQFWGQVHISLTLGPKEKFRKSKFPESFVI